MTSSGGTVPALLASPSVKGSPVHCACGLSSDSPQEVQCGSDLDPARVCASPVLSREKGSHRLTGSALPKATQDTTGLFFLRGTHLAHGQLVVDSDCQHIF